MADDAPTQQNTPTAIPTAQNGVTTTTLFQPGLQQTQPATGEDALGDAGKRALTAERTARTEAENLAKTLQRELETVRLSSLSDAEKAVEIARSETRAEVLRSVGGRLVEAEIKAAAAGRLASEQVEALLEGLDRTRFITGDGDVDRDALSSWITRVAPTSGPVRFGDADQGVRTTPPADNADERQVAKALFGNT